MRKVVSSINSAAMAASATTALLAIQKSSPRAFSTTSIAKGLDQLTDMPTSSNRVPSGKHAGPNKRVLNKGEEIRYKFIKRWELQMKESWDDFEAFKGQPKPKKQFGNEACEIVWPYAVLLENVVRVHRFTKSIYVYYPLKQETADGAFAAQVAKRFSHQYLVPITFHNPQCYVETETLVEYGEVPWVVVHCLDGRHTIIPIKVKAPTGEAAGKESSSSSDAADGSSPSASGALAQSLSGGAATFSPIDVKEAAQRVLNEVVSAAESLGNGVLNASSALTALHDRPLQNQYLRINYQWYGDTQEERSTHVVQWRWDDSKVLPSTSYKDSEVRNRLNFDGRFPSSPMARNAIFSERSRNMRKGSANSTGAGAMRSGQASRQNARSVRGGGNANPAL